MCKSIQKSLFRSIISLFLCLVMFIGETFAWFSDVAQSKYNTIVAGSLDLDLEYWNGERWDDVEPSSEVINNDALWEPGYTEVVYLKLKNAGSLDFKYQFGVSIVEETSGINQNGKTFKLSDYIYFDVIDGVNGETSPFANRTAAMQNVQNNTLISDGCQKSASLQSGDEIYLAMVIYMPTWVGNEAKHSGASIPEITLGISAFATQLSFDDSVNDDAEDEAEKPKQTYDLPTYWIDYLDEKIDEINTKIKSSNGKTDAFIFITDQHLDGSTKDYSASIINYISDNTSVNKVIFGGDTLQGGSSDVDILREYRDEFEDNVLVLASRGNHDATGNLTEQLYYDIMVNPLAQKAETSDKLYYYYDNSELKIRYIITDSVASGKNYLTSKEQISWMQSKILELDQDWTAIVFHHGIWEGSASNQVLNYSVDGKLIVDAIDEIYDSASCTVAGIYSGHTHRDYFGYSEKGYALVSTTVNASSAALSKYDLENPARPAETVKEETLDVVFLTPSENLIETIRIGAGSNRTYTYRSNAPADVAGVSLNKTEAITWVGGNAVNLKATLMPARVTNSEVVWRIKSGEDLGTITADGKNCVFTPGSKAGTATIEVKTVQGDYVAECTVSVLENEASFDITSEFTWTPGSITYADGVASSQYAKDWLYSNLVDVGMYDTITFTHVQTVNTVTPLGYAFYDANGKYITGESNGGGTYDTAVKTVAVPSNAKYFRVMWMNTTHSRYDAEKYELTSNFFCYGNVGNSKPDMTQEVQGINLNKAKAQTWVNGKQVDLLAIINPHNATNTAVVWSILSGEEFGVIQSDGLECIFMPGSLTGSVVIQAKTVDGSYTAECTIDVVENAKPVDITSEFTWTPGSITYADGVASSQYAKDWLYSNLVDVGMYDTITFTHVQTVNTVTPLGYAFYDANGKYITGESNGGGTYDTAVKTVAVPSNAKYFRVMWMNTTHSRYDAEKYELTSNFFCYGNFETELND